MALSCLCTRCVPVHTKSTLREDPALSSRAQSLLWKAPGSGPQRAGIVPMGEVSLSPCPCGHNSGSVPSQGENKLPSLASQPAAHCIHTASSQRTRVGPAACGSQWSGVRHARARGRVLDCLCSSSTGHSVLQTVT